MHFVLNKRLARERLLALIRRPNPSVRLVFGNQKSGTSAIAGLIAAAAGKPLITDFAGAQEPFIGKLIRGETSIADFVSRNAWAFSAPIVKEPSLTFVAPALMDHFGGARAVMVIRDPWQNIRSILERVDVRGDLDRVVQGTRRINPTWRSILAGDDLGLPPQHYIDVLARRWLRAAEIAEQLKDRLVLVRYEDFARAKQATIERLAGALSLPVVEDIAAIVDRPFQRQGRGADPKEFFGENYARIGRICGQEAARHGYA